MQNTDERKKLSCPLNGIACNSGQREDFASSEIGKLQCRWWVHLFGKDPQSEKIIDQWDCAIAWMPTCQIEGSQMTRQATASIDKVANVMAEIPLKFFGMRRQGLIDLKAEDGNGKE